MPCSSLAHSPPVPSHSALTCATNEGSEKHCRLHMRNEHSLGLQSHNTHAKA